MIRGFAEAERRWLEDDREEPRVVGTCSHCGEEIYEGDDIIEVDGEMICDSMECLKGFLDAETVGTTETVTCECCEEEVGEDYEMLLVNGEYVCDDFDCLLGYADAIRTTAGE